MRRPLLLAALLLSAPPALADDFLYMVCEMKGTETTMTLPSGQVISEGPLVVNSLRVKIDLKEQKMRSHKDPVWAVISVKGNQIIQNTQINDGGITGHISGFMPLNPPGPASINNWFKRGSEYQVIRGNGQCQEIDPSAWNAQS